MYDLLVTISVAKPSLLKEFLKSEGGQGGREELFLKKFLSPPCYCDGPFSLFYWFFFPPTIDIEPPNINVKEKAKDGSL